MEISMVGMVRPFELLFGRENDTSISDLMLYLKEGNRLQKPRHCDEKLYQTMMQCWAPDKKERPRFTDLVKFFDEHHRNVTRNRSRIWVSFPKSNPSSQIPTLCLTNFSVKQKEWLYPAYCSKYTGWYGNGA